MGYSKEYFSLQLKFAEKAAEYEKISLSKSLLKHTSFFKTFRIEGWKFNDDNPVWKSFLNKLGKSKDTLSVVYDFYLEQVQKKGEKNKKKMWGCFSYEYNEKENSVDLHFRNTDAPEPGALSRERESTRKNELKQMFNDIKKNYPKAGFVKGFSWLYNLNAYIRLFPPEYMNKYDIVTNWFRSTAIWGQFLDSRGDVKTEWAEKFLNCTKTKNSLKDLAGCFPLKVLAPKANIKYFYEFYGIK